MKTNRFPSLREGLKRLPVAFCTSLVCATTGLADAATASRDTGAGGNVESGTPEDNRLARLLREASFSPGVSEVAKMAQAGTDVSVLTAHVLKSDTPYKLRAEDLAHLRTHEVPDSVITAMIERGAEVRAEKRWRSDLPQPAPVPPAPTVTVVRAAKPPLPPVSTVTVIGRSDIDRGLSYRNYYYSPRNYHSPWRYGSVYASYGNYVRYGAGHLRGHGARVCR